MASTRRVLRHGFGSPPEFATPAASNSADDPSFELNKSGPPINHRRAIPPPGKSSTRSFHKTHSGTSPGATAVTDWKWEGFLIREDTTYVKINDYCNKTYKS